MTLIMDDIHKVLKNVRSDYEADTFGTQEADDNPIVQFEKWFSLAAQANLPDVNAMNLATCTKNGRPSSRIVLLRDATEEGFTFFTNYNSRKGNQLIENPYAALNFFWPELAKQIRVEGKVEKVDTKVSDEYFLSRPLESRIGAWASEQSQIIESRLVLEKKFLSLKESMGSEVMRPPHWGGFILKPDYFEFWQGRQSRLHDRVAYTLNNNQWRKATLSP